MEHAAIAAVDLGSNSFRLEVARVVEGQIYPLDVIKGPVRLGAGLQADDTLDAASCARALECLARFGERLRGMPRDAVRAVGTNTLRVARNGAEFLAAAEAALGYPIEIIAGLEEARLIYLGAAHSMPLVAYPRLVVDIGGGSTECIIGTGFEPQKLESLYLGCVSSTLRYFPDGRLTRRAFAAAERAARAELQSIRNEFNARHWQEAVGTSGTARSLCDILTQCGWADHCITLRGMDELLDVLLDLEQLSVVDLPGLRPDRMPVLPGGLAIMRAVFEELNIERMQVTLGALRDGVLYDLLGRQQQHDMRDVTVSDYQRRYAVDMAQAERVLALALQLYQALVGTVSDVAYRLHQLSWAARLHETGLSIAHHAYHKHSAYILEHGDMPGFSRPEQKILADLTLSHRGSLAKAEALLAQPESRAQVMALRLAVLFYRARREVALPEWQFSLKNGQFRLSLPATWLQQNPLTETLLEQEVQEWRAMGWVLKVRAQEASAHS